MFKKFKKNGLNEQLGNLNREMTTIENENSSAQNDNKLNEKVTRWVKGRCNQCQEKESIIVKGD